MLLVKIVLLTITTFSTVILGSLSEHKYTDTVHTDKGAIRGKILKTVQLKQKYSAFKGIPYAQPPIGEGRRFKRPVPAHSWNGILNTTQDSHPCSQPTFNGDDFNVIGSEDCLYLNVYTPELDFRNPRSRAVMVWIHGGAFQLGSASSSVYGPDFLIEKDVVVVAMNYRLGVLGFLSYLPEFYDANNGLRDQVKALRWTQRNIKKFGGAPDKVTIFGESAGAASVEFHKLSLQSQGLFRASIAMSGSALNMWAFRSNKETRATGFNFITQTVSSSLPLNEDEIYRKIAHIKPEHLHINALKAAVSEFTIFPFLPTDEDIYDSDDPFLIDRPENLYKLQAFSDKPHILGFMKDEGLFFMKYVNKLMEYTGLQGMTMLINRVTEYFFIKDIDRTQRFLTCYGNAPVYYYRNSFDYDQSLHKLNGNNEITGSAHTDDLAHIFWMENRNQPIDANSEIGKHRERMVVMWTNFAKYLIPIRLEDENLFGVQWKISGLMGHRLEINEKFLMNSRSNKKCE